jgi:wyosine [tRNA(Phe)-imidazoG37] synthetase (radical SAM superfamily)
LGRSLGVNLSPTDVKACSFDCVYCHYGRTEVKTLQPDAAQLPRADQVLEGIEKRLQTNSDIDYVTFSGTGEPTLHPEFPAIVSAVRDLRDKLAPTARSAILSNSTTAHLTAVREALEMIDMPIMKLDAGDARTLQRINRPAPGVHMEQIIQGLKGIPDLTLQSALIDGRVCNARGEPFEAWLAALEEIQPVRIQIYSTDRPVPEKYVERVKPDELREIASLVEQRLGITVDPFWQD